jgi:hypothetical protein
MLSGSVTGVQERRRPQICFRAKLLSFALVLSSLVAKQEKLMLALLLKRRGTIERATPLPAAVVQAADQSSDQTYKPNGSRKPTCENTGRKRRPRPVQIARLYPEPATEPLRQARALIDLIREECPDFVGRYVPKSDLERTYRELCAAGTWEPKHWTAIARQLGAMTKKRELKRSGMRSVAYQIPPPEFRRRSALRSLRNTASG